MKNKLMVCLMAATLLLSSCTVPPKEESADTTAATTAATTTAETTAETTSAPEITVAPETTSAPETTAAPEEPQLPETTDEKIYSITELNTAEGSADSHKDSTAQSRLETDFRTMRVLDGATTEALTNGVAYPRIKRLANGKYMFLYQQGQLSWTTYCAFSDNGTDFYGKKVLFETKKEKRSDGVEDNLCFATADAVVLENGDILVFCSYRYNKGYTVSAAFGGIVMRRSTDNGETFSDIQTVYVGRNWESYPLLLDSGEIQLYFSHTAPKFHLDKTVTQFNNKTSSGVGMIRSTDGGKTWTPSVTASAYGKENKVGASAQIVMQQYVGQTDIGTKQFTNQMPSAVELNNGKIALATEAKTSGSANFKISLGYSADNWAKPLGIDDEGPADRSINLFTGGAPYIAQFLSGETVLSYNTSSTFYTKIGDADGKNFGDAVKVFNNSGYWGSIEKVDEHSLVAVFPEMNGEAGAWKCKLCVGVQRLNHAVNAKSYSDGWEGNTDAIFVGSSSQAQGSYRFAYDEKNIYIRVDRLDYDMTNDDAVTVKLASPGSKDFVSVTAYTSGLYVCEKGKEAITASVGIKIKGTLGNNSDEDAGAIYEIAIARKDIGTISDEVKTAVELVNADAGKPVVIDKIENTSVSSTDRWISINIK